MLGLDTSTLSISAAIVRVEPTGESSVLASLERGPEGPNHSTLLPAWIEQLLARASLALHDLDGIAVAIGPGSFTGLRISLATAKGLAYAAKIPLCGVSTLEAMALGARRTLAGAEAGAGAIVPILDARKREVYAGFYRQEGEGVAPIEAGAAAEVVLPPAAVAERLAELEGPLFLFGGGYAAYRELFDEATGGRRAARDAGLPNAPSAIDVATLGGPRLGAYVKEDVFSLEPHYIRPSDVEFKSPSPEKLV